MKKLLLSICVILLINVLNAQIKTFTQANDDIIKSKAQSQLNLDHSKTQTCQDTLYYGLIKESLLSTVDTFYNAYCDYGEMHSQAFIVNSSIQVKGVSIYAQVANSYTPPISMQVFLYNVDANYKPTTQISGASATVSVTSTSLNEYIVNFPSPITVTQNFAIVVKNNTSGKRLYIIVNNAKTNTYGEGLSYTYYSSTWYSCASAYGQDFDALFSPIVSYSLTSSYTNTPSATTLCLGTQISFNQSSTPTDILTSRFFAFDAFRRYFGLTTNDSTYAWDMGDGSNLIWQPNHTYIYTNANTYTASLYTLSGLWNGCVDVSSKIFTIQAPPTAGTISGPTSLCQGYTGTLTLSGSTGTSYQWQQSTDGNIWTDISGATSTSYAIPSILTPGTYYYRVKVSSGTICSDVYTSSYQLVISPQPTVGTASASSTNICYNNQVTLSVNSYTGNIQWMQSTDGSNWTAISGGTTNPFTVTALTQTTYFKATVSSPGCNTVESNVIQVNVLTSIAGTASVNGPSQFCDIATAAYLVLTGSFGTIQWQQSTDGNIWTDISGATSSSYTVNNLTVTTYFRAMVTNGTCTETSNVLTITINSSPIAGTANISSNEICENNLITLSLSGYTPTATIQWQVSDNGGMSWTNISGATTTPYNYLPPYPTTYQFRAMVTNDCGSAYSNVLNLTVKPTPMSGTANISSNEICENNLITLSLSGYTPTATIQWQVSDNGGMSWTNIYGATTTPYNYLPSSAGTYQLRAIVTNNCGSVYSNILSLLVKPIPPTPTIYEISTNPIILQSSSTTGNQWFNQNGPISGAIYQTYEVTANGTYYVIVTLDGCSSAPSNSIEVTGLSIYSYNKNNVKVYPNPAKDLINVISDINIQQIQLIDILGNLIISTDEISIDVSNYSDGIYQLIIIFDDNRLIFPVIIQK
jgi:hypothetical protein